MKNAIILIPARFASSRFPGKPLALINHKSLIARVYDNCKKSGFETYVVTDDDKIEAHLKEIKASYVRVDDDVISGSERIYLAYERYFKQKNFTHIINVQGDEPLLTGSTINELFQAHAKSEFDIFTLIKRHNNKHNSDPDIVKVVWNELNKQCHYFSRAPIPYLRNHESKDYYWYQHIGIYSYKVEALEKVHKLKVHQLELWESLEQLRALMNNLTIGANKTELNLIGVDRPGDIAKVEGVLNHG